MYKGSIGVKKYIIAAINVLKNRYSSKENDDVVSVLIESFTGKNEAFHEITKTENGNTDHILVFLDEPIKATFLELCEALEAEYLASGIITRTVLHFGIVMESNDGKKTGVSLKNAHTMLSFMPHELSFAMTKAMKTEYELNSAIRNEITQRINFQKSPFHCQTLALFEPATKKQTNSQDYIFSTDLTFIQKAEEPIADSNQSSHCKFTEKELTAIKLLYTEYMGPMGGYVVTALNRSHINREDIIRKLTSDITSERERRVFQEKLDEDLKLLAETV